MKDLINNVSLSDAKKLIKWWNANTEFYHFLDKEGKRFKVLRQL